MQAVPLLPQTLFSCQVSGMSLDLVRQFPDVTTLNLGGGYKVGLIANSVSISASASLIVFVAIVVSASYRYIPLSHLVRRSLARGTNPHTCCGSSSSQETVAPNSYHHNHHHNDICNHRHHIPSTPAPAPAPKHPSKI